MAKASVLAAVFLLAGCDPMGLFGGGGKPTDFANVDHDGDASITPGELTAWGDEQGMFEMLGGAQGMIEPLDLASGLHGLWDMEGSGITEAEWAQGVEGWFPDADAGQFAEWDLSGEGSLDEDELRAGFAHTGIAESWDEDGSGDITDKEFYKAIYDVFDTDGDDTLTRREWTDGLNDWAWGF